MKTTNVRGNGHSQTLGVQSSPDLIEENPYLQSVVDSRRNPPGDDQPLHLSIEEEGISIEREEELRRVKQRRRRVALIGLTALFLVSLFAAVALYYRSSTRVEYGARARQREVLPSPPNAHPTSARDTRTEQAIAEAQRMTAAKTPTSDQASTNVNDVSPKSNLNPETPFVVPPGFNETVKPAPETANTRLIDESPSGAGSVRPSSDSNTQVNTGPIRSQRSSETSIYIGSTVPDRTDSARMDLRAKTDSEKSLAHAPRTESVVLPAFASMLPVRTIGVLYTLRTGALARFELTRDMKGDGWSMKRGTILVGTSKGGDFDRAYVGIIGFIEPDSGKLVKLVARFEAAMEELD